MATRRALVMVDGLPAELPAGDLLAMAAAVMDWPVLIAARDAEITIRDYEFTTLPLTATVDTHGGWDGSTWVVPAGQGGLYDVESSVRYSDSRPAGVSYGEGSGTSNADGPTFKWEATPTMAGGQTQRNGSVNQRTMALSPGDRVRLFTLHTFSGSDGRIIAASLVIKRIR